jgi:hypothetical protein
VTAFNPPNLYEVLLLPNNDRLRYAETALAGLLQVRLMPGLEHAGLVVAVIDPCISRDMAALQPETASAWLHSAKEASWPVRHPVRREQ